MYVNLFLTEKDYIDSECYMLCPSCDKYTLAWLEYNDYGSHVHMICSECWGLFVADCLLNCEHNWDDVEELEKVYSSSGIDVKEIDGKQVFHSFKVPLLFIEKVAGSNFSYITMKEEMKEKEVRKIYAEYKNGEKIPKELKEENKEEEEEEEENTKKMLFVSCNSYDIRKPAVPYPENLSTDHDGVIIRFMYDNGKVGYISGD